MQFEGVFMEMTEEMAAFACPEAVPYFLEEAFLEEAADLCSLCPEARAAFMQEAREIRGNREKTEQLWRCHYMLNNLGKAPHYVEQNFFMTYAVLAALPRTKAFYQMHGIPLSILKAGALDLQIWAVDGFEKTGKWGNLHWGWLKNSFNPSLFRLGRLEFEARLWHEENKLICRNGKLEFVPLDAKVDEPVLMQYQDMYIKVHIPALAPLDYEACKVSFAEARAFYPKYLPEIQPKCYRCCSWLMDRQLRHCLPEDSNILRFQSFFEDVYKADANDRQHRERIFGNPDIPLDQAPRKTSLQRNFIACLEQGVQFRTGQGIII